MNGFNFFLADQIHDGFRFLKEKTVLVFQKDGRFERVVSLDEIEKNEVKTFRGILCPGFVNAHCHLELSYLRGKIKEGGGLHEFIKEVEKQKQNSAEELQDAMQKADSEMYDSGINVVGDICNTNHSFSVKQKSSIYYHSFFEVYGFHPDRAEKVFENAVQLKNQWNKERGKNPFAVSIVPHAPYSVSEKLFSLLSGYASKWEAPLCMHSQESEDENLFFENKSGKILERLHQFGINTDFFQSTGKNSLNSTLHFLPTNRNLLLVHNTYTSQTDVQFAVSCHPLVYFCFCPRANHFIERRLPDFSIFSNLKDRLCMGTDSYASNYSFNFDEEIGFLKTLNPEIRMEDILKWSTSNGSKLDRKSTRLNSSHIPLSRMPSSA